MSLLQHARMVSFPFSSLLPSFVHFFLLAFILWSEREYILDMYCIAWLWSIHSALGHHLEECIHAQSYCLALELNNLLIPNLFTYPSTSPHNLFLLNFPQAPSANPSPYSYACMNVHILLQLYTMPCTLTHPSLPPPGLGCLCDHFQACFNPFLWFNSKISPKDLVLVFIL